MTISYIRKKNKKIKYAKLKPNERICSDNAKTIFSMNFPIIKTCRPTKVCSSICYGSKIGRPITWENSLAKQLKVFDYFQNTDAEIIADRIYKEYINKKMEFLRWNGVGDLFPKSVETINIILEKYKDVVLWVSTRIPELAIEIKNSPNVYIMFSLDESSKDRRDEVLKYNHPRIYFSYLRTDKNQDTLGSRIVFNSNKSIPYDDKETVCPVDAGTIPVNNACYICRKCFSDNTLNGIVHPKTEKNMDKKYKIMDKSVLKITETSNMLLDIINDMDDLSTTEKVLSIFFGGKNFLDNLNISDLAKKEIYEKINVLLGKDNI